MIPSRFQYASTPKTEEYKFNSKTAQLKNIPELIDIYEGMDSKRHKGVSGEKKKYLKLIFSKTKEMYSDHRENLKNLEDMEKENLKNEQQVKLLNKIIKDQLKVINENESKLAARETGINESYVKMQEETAQRERDLYFTRKNYLMKDQKKTDWEWSKRHLKVMQNNRSYFLKLMKIVTPL